MNNAIVHVCCWGFCSLTSKCFYVPGFHRNEDMKAIDVLPILKEKVAFLSGQKPNIVNIQLRITQSPKLFRKSQNHLLHI